MSELKPDEKGFRYVLMWIRHLIKQRESPSQNYLIEWEEFIVAAEKRIAELEEESDRRLQKWLIALETIGEMKAKIDALMLEYCPDEMTQEQIAEYAKHQKPAQSQAVPDSWKLVPIEPTNDMAEAYWKYNDRTDVIMRDAWKAMLTVAPTPAGRQQSELAAEYARGRNDGWDAAKLHSTQQPPAANAAQDVVTIPVKPTDGLLMSMAIRYDHALGCDGYYDHPLFADSGITHKERLDGAIRRMRQLHEEVVGAGFYRPEKESDYAAMKTAAPSDGRE